LHATCAALTSGIWHCPDTGNPSTNGTDLKSFFASKPWSCGDTIVLYAGVVYRGAETAPASSLAELKSQTGCNGKYTQIISSQLASIPYGKFQNLANYRANMPTIEVGANSAFQLVSSVNGGTNNYALRGIRITSSAWTVANRVRVALLFFANEFLWTDTNLRLYSPRNIEIDRCIGEDYEQAIYGYPNTSNTDGNAFIRGITQGIDGPFQNMYIHDSFFVFDGYTISSGSAETTDWITISTATATNPAVVQGTTLTTQLGITYNASCTSACDGWDSSGPCLGACARVVIRGGTGNWTALNTNRFARARADGNVDIVVPNPDFNNNATYLDASGFGAFTATSPQIARAAGLVQYAISASASASNWRIENNFIEAWAIPFFFGGADGAPIDPAVIQTGSTASALILNHVNRLKVGDMITFNVPPGSGPSTYCYTGIGSTGCGAVDTFRVGKVTAIAGLVATIEPWGVDGTDGTTPQTGGAAVWQTWKVEGIQARGNAVSRGWLQSNAAAGKGVAEIKKCSNCLFDGNTMGGYLDTANVMRGNVGGTYFTECLNQGGWDPNNTCFNARFSNNLGSGQLGGGSASCLWSNTMTGNYVGYHSAKTAEGLYFEHNVATGCQAVDFTTLTHINTLTAYNSYFQHNTFAPDMAQVNAYQFARNSDCEPSGTAGFPFFPEIGRNLVTGVKNNIIGYGNGPLQGAPNNATCWPTLATDFVNNIAVDTQSVGLPVIAAAYPGNFPVANYTNFWEGSCDYTTWTNCYLKSTNPNRGAATDGGDPGADILQVNDRLHSWSEQAGLLQAYPNATVSLNGGSWSIGSVAAVVNFNLFNSTPASGCTVQLFTNANRSTAHADTPTAAACNRASSPTLTGARASFVFGGSSALTANTTYYWQVTDGTRIMVGSFRTAPTRATNLTLTYPYPSARTGQLCTNPGMSAGCTSYGTVARQVVTVPTGTIRYYQAGDQPIQPLTW